MEREPGSFNNNRPTPERSWSPFEEDPEKDKENEKKPEKPKKRWFEEDKPAETTNKEGAEEKDAKKRPSAKSRTGRKGKQPEQEDARTKELPAIGSEAFDALSETEQKHVVARHIVAERAEQLEAEIEELPPGSPEAIGKAANLALIEALDEKLANPDLEVGEAVEEAYQNIMAELEEIMNPPEEDLEEIEALDEYQELEDQDEDKPLILKKISGAKKATKPPKRRSQTDTTTTTNSKGASHTTSPNSAPTSSGGMERGVEVNQTAAPRSEALPPLSQEVETSKAMRRKRASNVVVSNALTEMFDRSSQHTARAHEVPTVVHESAPLPTSQSRPERVVNPIRHSIEEKEAKIRRLATSQVVRTPFESAPTQTTTHFERPAVSVEAVRPSGSEQRSRQLDQQTSRNLKQASTTELLEIGSKIRVDGLSLRELYTRNEIDRKGLSKIVAEALKGGDIKRAFRKVRLGEEARLGRKMEVRHDDPKKLPFADIKTDDAARNARTNQLLEALHAVQRTTAQAYEGNTPHVPERSELESAVKQQRRAAYISVAAVTTAVVGSVLGLLFFVF